VPRERTADVTGEPGARTEVDPTELGTEAASPKAISEAAAVAQNAQSAFVEQAVARPSGWSTSSRAPMLSAADVLDGSELPRMRVFGAFGMTGSILAMALSVVVGGDPLAQRLFWSGAGILLVLNAWLVWMTFDKTRYTIARTAAVWVGSAIGLIPAIYYFGPFSAVVIVPMLGIIFVSIGRSIRVSIAVTAIVVGGQVALAVPITAGVVADRGILPSTLTSMVQLAIAEVLIVAFLSSGFLLGRWARKTNAAALAELQSAMRLIGDQQQALAEVVQEAERQKRVNEGRWTGHQMGGFKLGLVLGRGAMGEVYEATARDGSDAAVKLLNARATGSSSIVERFHREMLVAARLESPHIVKVFDVSPPDAPVPYIAMERLRGQDLATRLRAQNRMPSDEIVVLIDQVARGLEVARVAGVVHRDLKPHNLFHHEGTSWKILDFGVSKVMDSEGTLTGDGIVGTPQYMAPEQASGGQVTHLADVYALGAIAYRCLTGRSPFKGRELAELVYQVVHVAPVRPGALGRVSRAVEDVLAVAMAKDPRRRFPSAISFAQAFVAARRGRLVQVEVPHDAWS
jgi:hypothetical protein